MTARELALEICKNLSERKAEDIVYMDVESKTTLCSYFVIASASNSTLVKALAEHLEEKMEKNFELSPSRTEGKQEGRWAVIDYGDVIVHIFLDECRLFYHLERLWEEGSKIERYAD